MVSSVASKQEGSWVGSLWVLLVQGVPQLSPNVKCNYILAFSSRHRASQVNTVKHDLTELFFLR